jgi:hypothetical protein
MTEGELRKKIGNAKFDEIRTLVQKAKAEGKSPDEIAALVRTRFRGDPDVIDNVQTFVEAEIPHAR